MPSTQPVLQVLGVTREFTAGSGMIQALKGVSLDVEEGGLTCLKGRSGSGKTTLLNIMGALDRPTSGEVLWEGENITEMTELKRDRLRRNEMAFVFQSVALIGTMTALENVELALRLAGIGAKGRTERALECLRRVGLEKRAGHRPGELSGGEQQRVAIARAICHNPKIIFADEPTAELDTQTGLAVINLFRELTSGADNFKGSNTDEKRHTIVMTTHDEAMMELADVVYTLSDGEITEARNAFGLMPASGKGKA